MNMKKIATMATCMALVGAVAVGGTLALVTRNDSITNTFVVGEGFPGDQDGKTFFYVDEATVKMNTVTGDWEAVNAGENRTQKNQTYGPGEGVSANWKVVGNSTLFKDPTFHLDGTLLQEGESAPAAYVVAYIDWANESEANKKFYNIYNTTESSNWYKIEEDGTATKVTKATEMAEGYYLYLDSLTATKGQTVDTEALFNEVKVANDVAENSTVNLNVYGVAVEKAPGMVDLTNETLEANKAQVKALYDTAATVINGQLSGQA